MKMKCRPVLGLLLIASPLTLAVAGLSEDLEKANGALPPGWAFLSAVEAKAKDGAPVQLESFEAMQPDPKGGWSAAAKAGGKPAQWKIAEGRLVATPGRAGADAGSPAVAAYTIPAGQAGFYSLDESILQIPQGAADNRIDLRVFVRHAGWAEERQPGPAVWTGLDAGELFDFDTFLGYLDAGDTIYIAVGPAGNAAGDQAAMDFRVNRAPSIAVSAFPEDFGSKSALKSATNWTMSSNVPADAARLLSQPAESAFELKGSIARAQLSGAGQDAVAAFRIPQSGYYALDGAWAAASGAAKAQIFVGAETSPRRTVALPAAGDQKTSLNTDLGYIEKGASVFLSFSGEDKPASVEFGASVVEWAPRRAPLRVQRGADGHLDVYEPAAPRVAVDIPKDRWITVAAQKGDATETLRKAFEDARAAQKGDAYVGIRLERGKSYTIGTELKENALFDLRNLQRIVFDANGATLVINYPEYQRKLIDLFRLQDSSRMVFADLIVEDTSFPYTVGEVLKVDPPNENTTTVTFRVEKGYPDPLADISRRGRSNAYAYNPAIPGRLALGVWSHFPGYGDPSIKATGTPGEYTHSVTRTGGTITTGTKWLIKNKDAGVNYLVTRGSSEDVTLWKLDARASGGGLLRFWQSSGVNILDSKLEPIKERWLSTTSDGVHGRGREGVWIEDTVIRGICEDIMNTYGETMVVEADDNAEDNVFSIRMFARSPNAPGGRELRVPGPNSIRVGDPLVFFNPKTGRILAYTKVTAIADGRFTLSQAVSNVDTWEPEDGKGSTMVYNESSAARFFVRDSRFMDSMRFGIYIKAQGGVIFHNHFEGLSSPAVFAANEPEWPEGPPATHLWIQGNSFSQNNFGYMSRNRDFMVVDPAEISVYTRRLRDRSEADDYRANLTTGQFANSHVKILGNTFHDWRGLAVAVRNSRNVLIADNFFLPPVDDDVMRKTLSQDPVLNADGKGGYAAIFLDSVEGARVLDNYFYGLPSGDRPLVIGGNVKDIVETGNISSNVGPADLAVALGFPEWFGTSSSESAPAGAVKDTVDLRDAARLVGQLGAGVTFNGQDSLAVLNASTDVLGKPSGQFTLALWLRPEDGASAAQVAYEQADAQRGVIVAIDQGRLIAGLWQDDKGAWLDLGPVTQNVWQHVALVYDGKAGTLRGFRDGQEVVSATENVPAELAAISSDAAFGGVLNPARLGPDRTLKPGTSGYRGVVDEFYLFRRVIDPVEIAALAMCRPVLVAQMD